MNPQQTRELFARGAIPWNVWADEMRLKKRELQDSSQWTDSPRSAWNTATCEWNERAKADFSGHVFDTPAYFNNFRFPGDAAFKSAVFEQQAEFEDAKFLGDAIFIDAELSRGSSFARAQFTGDANFAEAMFLTRLRTSTTSAFPAMPHLSPPSSSNKPSSKTRNSLATPSLSMQSYRVALVSLAHNSPATQILRRPRSMESPRSSAPNSTAPHTFTARSSRPTRTSTTRNSTQPLRSKTQNFSNGRSFTRHPSLAEPFSKAPSSTNIHR